jgi:hypothetical protein
LHSPLTVAGKGRPVVRAARADDLEAIVNLEFAALHDAYESPLDPRTVSEVRQKFADRLELLGHWVRVLELPGGNIVGMSLAYPIRLGREELAELCDLGYDMAETEVIRSLIDKDGTTSWGLNLAVSPSAGILSGMSFLAPDMMALRAAHGIQRGFFFSRIPGLAGWASGQLPGVNVTELHRATQDALASRYVHATVHPGGTSKAADPLLGMYVASGAVPFKLVSRWGVARPARGLIDLPSLGYHVLCERRFDGTRPAGNDWPSQSSFRG